MSANRLRIFSPDDSPQASETSDRPHVISFERARRAVVVSRRLSAATERARLIHHNSSCPECHRSAVEPLELNDGLTARGNRLIVPGTATLVGFHCNNCGYEWPVVELGSEH